MILLVSKGFHKVINCHQITSYLFVRTLFPGREKKLFLSWLIKPNCCFHFSWHCAQTNVIWWPMAIISHLSSFNKYSGHRLNRGMDWHQGFSELINQNLVFRVESTQCYWVVWTTNVIFSLSNMWQFGANPALNWQADHQRNIERMHAFDNKSIRDKLAYEQH